MANAKLNIGAMKKVIVATFSVDIDESNKEYDITFTAKDVDGFSQSYLAVVESLEAFSKASDNITEANKARTDVLDKAVEYVETLITKEALAEIVKQYDVPLEFVFVTAIMATILEAMTAKLKERTGTELKKLDEV